MSSEELKSSTLVLVVICLYASFQRWLKDTLVGVGGMGGSSLRSCWLIILPVSFLPRTKQTWKAGILSV